MSEAAPKRCGRAAKIIAPGEAYPAGVIVREVERNANGRRRFDVRRACGHVVRTDWRNLRVPHTRCLACERADRDAHEARGRAGFAARLQKSREVKAGQLRKLGLEPGSFLGEIHVDALEPSTIASLDDFRRALVPGSFDHCGTVRARWTGEAA